MQVDKVMRGFQCRRFRRRSVQSRPACAPVRAPGKGATDDRHERASRPEDTRHAAGPARRRHLHELVPCARVRGLRRQDRQGLGAGEVPQEPGSSRTTPTICSPAAAPSSRARRRSRSCCASRARARRACADGQAAAGPADAASTARASVARCRRRHRGVVSSRRAGGRAHQRRRLRGLAARSALYLRQLRRRRLEPHGACRRHAGRRYGDERRAAASIRSTSTPPWASARRTSCTPSPGR